MQCIVEKLQSPRIVEKIVFKIGVALYDPDVPKDLVQHASRSTGTSLIAQLLDETPSVRAQ